MNGRVLGSALMMFLAVTNVPAVVAVRRAKSSLGIVLILAVCVCLVTAGTVIGLAAERRLRRRVVEPGEWRRDLSRAAFRVAVASWLTVAWFLGHFSMAAK